jgi:hypothetical protein
MDPASPSAKPVPLVDRISREFLVHHQMCPVGLLEDGGLAVAITEHSLRDGLDDLSIAYERRVVPELTTPQDLDMRMPARKRASNSNILTQKTRASHRMCATWRISPRWCGS